MSNKQTLLWLLIRLFATGLIFTGCLSLLSLANTGLNLIAVAVILVLFYYWLPNNDEWTMTSKRFKELFYEEE